MLNYFRNILPPQQVLHVSRNRKKTGRIRHHVFYTHSTGKFTRSNVSAAYFLRINRVLLVGTGLKFTRWCNAPHIGDPVCTANLSAKHLGVRQTVSWLKSNLSTY